MRPSNSFHIHPIALFLPLIELALFQPLAIWRQAAPLPPQGGMGPNLSGKAPHGAEPRKAPRLPRPWDSPGKNTGVGCHFLLQCMKVKSEREVAQSCPTHSNPMDYSPPGSSVHGILQARVLEWGAIAFSFKVHLLILLYSYESLRVRNFSLLTDEKYNFQRC